MWLWVDTYDETKSETYTGLADPETGAVLNAEVSMNIFGFEGSYADKKEDEYKDIEGNSMGFLGFEGSYADKKEDEYKDIEGNSMGFLGSMKSLSENKGGFQEYFEQTIKK